MGIIEFMRKTQNTTYDFFYLLSIQATFQIDIKNFRIKYGIRESGYDFDREADIMHYEQIDFFTKNPDLVYSYKTDVEALAHKYQVPANLSSRFLLFLQLDHTTDDFLVSLANSVNQIYALDYSTNDKYPIEEIWKTSGRSYVKLLISENWSVSGLESFLKRHETLIKSFFNKNGQLLAKKNRKRSNLERDEIIWKLWRLTLAELNEMNIETYHIKYKERAISAILKSEYDYKVSPEAVKKTAERQAGLRDN